MKSTNIRSRSGSHALRFIAGLKLFEAVVLIAAGVAALGLLDAGWQHLLSQWLSDLSLQEGRRLTSRLAERSIALLGMTTSERLALVAIGCFAYAIVFFVEALGLWLRRRWGSYFTSIATASLLPIEALEVLRQPSAPRLSVLIVNLLVVVYLIWNLVAQRSSAAHLPG